jgi:hypothetical protein
MAKLPMGSAGFVCTPRMSALIAQAGSGVLPSDEGGQELRDLYQEGQSFFCTFVLIGPRNTFANSLCWVGSSPARWFCLQVPHR